MNAAKQKNKSPAENLVSSAAPKARPNRRIVPRDGDRHMLAKAHNVSTKNNVIAREGNTMTLRQSLVPEMPGDLKQLVAEEK